MPAHKGHKKAGGRKPGSKNKTTSAVKAALVQAFDEMGGVETLVAWGKKNKTEFYKIWSKLLPTEIKNADGEALRMQIVEEYVTAEPDEDHHPAAPALPPAGGLPP